MKPSMPLSIYSIEYLVLCDILSIYVAESRLKKCVVEDKSRLKKCIE
jgi:hypothetical protein